MTTSTTSAKSILRAAAALIFWLAVWYFAARAVGQELILPSPFTVLSALIGLCGTGGFWLTAGSSLLNILAGLAAGTILGVLLAAATSASRLLNALLAPVIRIVRATPVASFIILALLWTGKTRVPSLISAMMVAPVIWGSVTAAVAETDRGLLEMARMFSFGRLKTLRLIYIPSAMPSFEAALATSVGLAWKSGVAAEVLCQVRYTIGAELYYSKIYLETPALFAWTAVVVAFSLILERAVTSVISAAGRRRAND